MPFVFDFSFSVLIANNTNILLLYCLFISEILAVYYEKKFTHKFSSVNAFCCSWSW